MNHQTFFKHILGKVRFHFKPIQIDSNISFSQIHERLNPETSLNQKVNCPGCCVLRNAQNHENVQEFPIIKNHSRLLKQIQTLRRIKKRTKKQENTLKHLLMRINGFQVKLDIYKIKINKCLMIFYLQKIICKLCSYIVKVPAVRKDTVIRAQFSTKKSSIQQLIAKQDFHHENISMQRKKKKTAGLNPLYVKSKTSQTAQNNIQMFKSPKNVQKLSQMLKISDNKNNTTSHPNRLHLLLE